MKILHINKFLYRRGGAEAYMLDLAALQSAQGDEVAFFGMAHPQNERNDFEASFPRYISFNPPPESLRGKLRLVGRTLYSSSARRGIEDVLDRFQPDVVHAHNVYHQLSPSVLQPLRKRGLPTVMTLHDYKLACPTYLFLDKGQVCEACLGGRFHQAILRRCSGGSLAASALSAAEASLHTATGAYDPVAIFACPSRFILGKMTEAGVFVDRLRHIPNFIDGRSIEPKERAGGGVVYAGRLSPEKGVDTLIGAVVEAGVPLDIAGTGPQSETYEALARRHPDARIRFHGHMSKDRLHRLIRSASVLAVPSRCHENQPLIVLEALATGVPVVTTTLGGLSELVEIGIDGDLVPPNDASALAEALRPFVSDPDLSFEMGRAGRAKVMTHFDPEAHLSRLGSLYAEARVR